MGIDGKPNFYTIRRNANARCDRGVRVHVVACVNHSIIHVIYDIKLLKLLLLFLF